MPAAELAFEYLAAALETTRGTAITAPTHYLPLMGTITGSGVASSSSPNGDNHFGTVTSRPGLRALSAMTVPICSGRRVGRRSSVTPAVRSVWTAVGMTVVMVTSVWAISARTARDNAATAYFVAQYTDIPGVVTLAAIDATFTMWP